MNDEDSSGGRPLVQVPTTSNPSPYKFTFTPPPQEPVWIPSVWTVPAPVFTVSKKVATEPFPDMSVKTVKKGDGQVKVGMIANQSALVGLKVVYPSEDGRFQPGMMVYVRGSLYGSPWGKETLELDGQTVILVPEDRIEIVKR